MTSFLYSKIIINGILIIGDTMKNRKSILLVVLLLVVGFAAVSTTLYINGSTNINPNQDDFNVYYSDAYVNGTKDLSVIKDDTVIEFTTTFEKINQKDLSACQRSPCLPL